MSGFDLIKYDSGFGMVELTPDTVKQYLVKGNGAVTDQEAQRFTLLTTPSSRELRTAIL